MRALRKFRDQLVTSLLASPLGLRLMVLCAVAQVATWALVPGQYTVPAGTIALGILWAGAFVWTMWESVRGRRHQ